METVQSGFISHIIPLHKYESALDCSGSFLQHFSLDDNKTPEGIEAQDLLMELLVPLLGRKIQYSSFLGALNVYLQTKVYRSGEAKLTENMRRYIEAASLKWKRHREVG
jgi:hypothetical protein